MSARKRPLEYRWVVVREELDDDMNDLRDEFPILYGSEEDAKVMLNHLNAGSDKSYFDGENGVLSVQRIVI